MKASKFSDAQKAFILRQGADGVPVAYICRKAGISQATYFNWKKKYDGVICYPSLDRRKVEFSGFCHAGGLDAPAGIMREAGGLLPMAPCGRSSL